MTRPQAMAPDRLFTRSFAVVFAAALVFFVSGGIALPVAPRFATGPIGADALGFGVAIGIFAIASLAVRPLVGWIADRFGRRPLLIVGAFLTAGAFLLHLAATSLPLFVVARAILGAAEAAFLVAAISAGGDLAPAKRTGEALSLMSLSIYVGLAIGPVVGETVLAQGGFGAVWIAAAGLAVVAGVLGVLAPETRPVVPSMDPGTRGRLFHPAGVLPGLLVLSATWGMAAFLTFIPLHALELGLDGAGPALALFGVVVLALRLFGAKIPDRVGPVRLAGTALATTAVGLLLVGVLPGQVGLLVGSVVFAVGIALSVPAILTLAMSRAPAAERGSVVGTTSLFLDLSFGIAPVVLAPLAAAAGYPSVFVASAAVAGVGVLVLLSRRRTVVPASSPAG